MTDDCGRFRFDVYCYAADHPDRRPFIDSLQREQEFGGAWIWMGSNPNAVSGTKNSRRSMLLVDKATGAPSARVAAHADGKPVHRSSERRHFELPCPLCGINVRATDETLDSILDDLMRAVTTLPDSPRAAALPLGLLAAKVSGK